MTYKRTVAFIWEFLSVCALSLALGTGIGFFQGELSTGSQLGDIRMALPNEGAMAGLIFSIPTGLVVYYLILRRNVSFRTFRDAIGMIVLVSTLVGLSVGYLTKGTAALPSSLLMVVVVLVVFGVLGAAAPRPTTENGRTEKGL